MLIGLEGRLAGALVMGDRVRPDARELVRSLRDVGIRHIAMLSGDRADVARAVGAQLGHGSRLRRAAPRGQARVVATDARRPGGSLRS